MPLKTLQLRAGIFRENTRYAAENGWYECDKIRFRLGQPEKIGGWKQISNDTFQGVGRSLWPWSIYLGLGTNVKYYIYYGAYYDITPIRVTSTVAAITTYSGFSYAAVADAGAGVGAFDTGELTVGSYVTFTSPGTLGGINFATSGVNGTAEYEIISNVTLVTCSTSGSTLTVSAVTSPGIIVSGAVININGIDYTITGTGTTGSYTLSGTPSPAVPAGTQLGVENAAKYFIQAKNPSTGLPINANATPPTSASGITAAYQVSIGSEIQYTSASLFGTGWGSGGWGSGGWGGAGAYTVGNPTQIGLWNAYNFGNDLIYGPKGGGTYYWTAGGLTTRGINISTLPGASDTPSKTNFRLVSDASRFVLAFGTTNYNSTTLNPMLIRWSDQESAANWTPSATTQAGSLLLSHGSEIMAVAQMRQEIIVWTDTAMYSLQYLGPPIVWGSQILADNITIASDRAWAVASGVVYWMGDGKFYVFDGRTSTLQCDIRKFIFDDFNDDQNLQVFASTIEQYNEIWWVYCSITGPNGTGTTANPNTTIDRYAVYNYLEKVWYYGTLARTAWIDASVYSSYPIAADYNKRLLEHEKGCDDQATTTAAPITAYIVSSEFDIADGDSFGFVTRVLPDVTFAGSTAAVENQSLNMALLPMQNSGSGYTRGVNSVTENSNMSVALQNERTIERVASSNIEQFQGRYTGTITPYQGNLYIRVRGRQMAIRAKSTDLGVQWQLGKFRIDLRPDGRKS